MFNIFFINDWFVVNKSNQNKIILHIYNVNNIKDIEYIKKFGENLKKFV